MNELVLKILVGIAGLTFVMVGFRTIWLGGKIVGKDFLVNKDADSDIRFQGALASGIGLLLWTCIPTISIQSDLFTSLCSIIFLAGLVRLITILFKGGFKGRIAVAVITELTLSPLLLFWQTHLL